MESEVLLLYNVLSVEPNLHSNETSYLSNEAMPGFRVHARVDYSCDIPGLLHKEAISLLLVLIRGAHEPGIRLCERVRSVSQVPIILVGGSGDFKLARKALSLNVSDYLPDPVTPVELNHSLKAVKWKLDSMKSRPPAAANAVKEMRMEQERCSCPIIRAMKQYVQEQMDRNLTLKQIADHLNFNCAYLGQKFKQHENMSFNEYLLRQRMERAKQLLETTDMKIYEIAAAVGYTEIDWFYKKFRAYTGASANEYRKQCLVTA